MVDDCKKFILNKRKSNEIEIKSGEDVNTILSIKNTIFR